MQHTHCYAKIAANIAANIAKNKDKQQVCFHSLRRGTRGQIHAGTCIPAPHPPPPPVAPPWVSNWGSSGSRGLRLDSFSAAVSSKHSRSPSKAFDISLSHVEKRMQQAGSVQNAQLKMQRYL